MSQTKYSRFSDEKRKILQILLAAGESPGEIAGVLGMHPCSIYREIKRGSTDSKNKTTRVNCPQAAKLDARHYRGSVRSGEIIQAKQNYHTRKAVFERNKSKYKASVAITKAKERRREYEPLLDREEYSRTRQYIDKALAKRWSPEQISGRLKLEDNLPCVSYGTIYNYVYSQVDDNGKPTLVKHLRRRGKPYRHKRGQTYNQTDRARHSIHDRQAVVETRTRIGDLEGDTIVGQDTRDRLITEVDRTTLVVSISKVIGFNAYTVAKQMVKDIKRVHPEAKTNTLDNGVEFSSWKLVDKELSRLGSDKGNNDSNDGDSDSYANFTTYFADPYTPGQRGTNENTNGLIRDYFPKGTDFKKLTERDILKVEDSLNNRPRKSLQYLTPLEYAAKLRSVALEI